MKYLLVSSKWLLYLPSLIARPLPAFKMRGGNIESWEWPRDEANTCTDCNITDLSKGLTKNSNLASEYLFNVSLVSGTAYTYTIT